jgi:condensin-2 complex subunit D3
VFANIFSPQTPTQGEAHARRREYLYKFMLDRCSNLDRLQITQQLCQDVLGAVLDDASAARPSLVRDALTLLASQDMKPRGGGGGGGSAAGASGVAGGANDADGDGDEVAEAQAAAHAHAQNQLYTKVAKKHLVDTVLPIVLSLKAACEQRRSPLTQHVMRYLREVMRDYAEEMDGTRFAWKDV